MFDLSPQTIMTLISVASKACEHREQFLKGLHGSGMQFEASQVDAIILEASKLLAHLDEEYPSIVPVPHDGVQWKDRIE